MKPIAYIYNNYTEKFGIPRQSGLVGDSFSRIVFEPEYRNPDALRGLDGFSHIWLIWEFSEVVKNRKESLKEGHEWDEPKASWSPTVRPPRLGGNERIGVFASRSPFRPNPLGLSCVRLEEIIYEGVNAPVLRVSGADLMNGTPIFDIKPYIAYSDAHPEALAGWTGEYGFPKVQVDFLPEVTGLLTEDELLELKEMLQNDPRPAYQRNRQKEYRFKFAGKEISVSADKEILTVTGIS
ncbi:MAG: tRNA (N6-threonylcarbamoyladenosine(37)-N6)-methyltransferase TrmO [Lachnospiraceae bacterium]|nr:tRNA (N6-threonylcarbamoyladenosine(37)-N6)-methyltransferase TrmO [Lachnospiraceae bacterium]